MRRDQQLYLADVVQQHRLHLASVLAEFVARGDSVSELEATLLLEAADVRLSQVENALRYDPDQVAGFRARARLVLARLQSWTKPRIGRLIHYGPRPLRVPARYLRTQVADSAPMISVVTPSYEQGRFLARTVYSVVAQGYAPLEYFVHDGGSSDESVGVLRQFESSLAGWVSEADGGQADAINRAFERTSGEIMAWLNSDDLLLPGSLAYVGRYFQRHPDVDVIYGHRIIIDENDGQVGAWILPRHSDTALTLADYVPQETLFWRRRVWDAAGGAVDPSFSYALDWDLLLRFREVGARIVRVPRFLGAFRVHPEQKTSARDTIGLDEMAQLRQRVHGRPVTVDEALVRLRPYFLRHIGLHTVQRMIDRVPTKRVYVQTLPDAGTGALGLGSDSAARDDGLSDLSRGDTGAAPLSDVTRAAFRR